MYKTHYLFIMPVYTDQSKPTINVSKYLLHDHLCLKHVYKRSTRIDTEVKQD